MEENKELIEMTSKIVASFVGNNKLEITDIPALVRTTYESLASKGDNGGSISANGKTVPARELSSSEIKKSIHKDYLICFEDGKRFKSLKRHLRSHYDMSPKEYREKWGLPSDYPMVAPEYSKARRALALKMGLGIRTEE